MMTDVTIVEIETSWAGTVSLIRNETVVYSYTCVDCRRTFPNQKEASRSANHAFDCYKRKYLRAEAEKAADYDGRA